MHFDLSRRLRHSHWRVLVKILFHGAAILDVDFVTHHVAHAFDDRALHLIYGVERVDYLTADVGRDPNFVDLNPIRRIDLDLSDFSKVTGMAEMKGDAFGGSFRQTPFAPI